MKPLFPLLLSLFLLKVVNAQTVQTQYGPVTGHMNANVYEFLGIPFASPPVDELRWKPTIAPENWTTPIVADSFPPMCPQKRYEIGDTTYTLEGEEDCLYLNVWTPNTSARLPVMVFIHGGGNQQGSSGQISGGTEIYHGKNLAERGNVVVVTIQYRLGALGYLVHPGLELENTEGISGNYGVMDQIFALQWVHNNIAAFGGDTSNVTIFGESAGGVNVGNLLTSPLANGLFHRAIIESAVPVINDYDTAKVEGVEFVNEFISSGSDSLKIAFMRTIPVDSITIKMKNPLEGGVVQMAWQPVVDNYIFPDYPEEVFQTGNFNKVPLMIGSNADEMRPMVPQIVYPFMVTQLINNIFPPEYQTEALSLYPPGSTNSEAKDSYTGILTDAQFTATTRRTAQCVSLNQTDPVWRYFFTHTLNPSIPIVGDWKAYHSIELFYVFNTLENSSINLWSTQQDDSVQHITLKYWTNFAYTGNPNGSDLPNWPQYDANTDNYLEIKATPDGSQSGLRTAKCDLWDDIIGYTGCTTTSISDESNIPKEYVLYQNYPNPFNPSTKINYSIPKTSFVTIKVFDVIGKEIATLVNEEKSPGNYEVDFNGSNLSSGIYFYRIQSGEFTETKKFVLLR